MAELRRFGDFATFKYGKMPDKKKLTESGKYPVYSGYRYVGYYDEYNTEANQIIVVARGVGGTGDVKLTKERCYLTNLSISADIDENIALPEFIYYYYLQHNLRYLDSGSAQSQITISDLEKVMIPLPSLGEQRAICGYMKMLDRKIEINEAVNENLQAQSFAIFDNLISTSASELVPLSYIAELNPKRQLSKGVTARCIDMSALSTTSTFPSGWEMKSYNGGMRFANGDTIIARITPCLENGKTAYIDFLDESEVAFGSTEYIVISSRGAFPSEFFYCLARYPSFVDYAVVNMNGSSGRQRVSADILGKYCLPLLTEKEVSVFANTVPALFRLMRNNSLENLRLASLRDSLLPRLMSGEMDVSAQDL